MKYTGSGISAIKGIEFLCEDDCYRIVSDRKVDFVHGLVDANHMYAVCSDQGTVAKVRRMDTGEVYTMALRVLGKYGRL